MITRENYEEYMMMHADGELSPSQEQELMSFLYEHPEFQHELTAFKMTKIIPDDSLVYTRKVSLLKPEGGAALVTFAPWKRYAIAAGVAALLMLGTYNVVNHAGSEAPAIAETNAPVEITTPAQALLASADAAHTENAATAAPEVKKEAEVSVPVEIKSTASRKLAAVESHSNAFNSKHLNAQNTKVAANEVVINKVNPAEMVAYEKGQEISSATVTNLPPAAIYIYEGENETKQSIVDKLPIDDLKKEGMENVVTAMANGYDRINAIKQGISETVVSFKVEKRKLIVSF